MRSFKERTKVVDGHIVCNTCHESKEVRFFSKIKESNSYRGKCTQCRYNSKTSRFKQQDIVLNLHKQGLKECVTCKITKPITEYHKNKNTRFGLSANCKQCSLNHRISYKDTLLYKKYKLPNGQFNIMLKNQKNRCLICKNTFGEMPSTMAVVDHCHETGVVRGLLCGFCNKSLGGFKDNPESLHSAFIYLQNNYHDKGIEYCI